MGKCTDCTEWEYFEGYGYGCFCMKTMIPLDDECENFCDKHKPIDIYKGKYSVSLKNYFEAIYFNMKDGVPDTEQAISVTMSLSYDKLKDMFYDIEEIKPEQWSEYGIRLEKDNEESLSIGFYREPDEVVVENQKEYPDEDIIATYSIEFFVGGDLANNIGGDLTTCIIINVTKEHKLII